MQRLICVIACWLCLAVIATGCRMRSVPQYPPSSKSYTYPLQVVGSLSGRVFIDGQPNQLKEVRIEARSGPGEKPLAITKSNSKGAFQLNLPKGLYILRFSLKGFDTVNVPVDYDASGGPELEVPLPPST